MDDVTSRRGQPSSADTGTVVGRDDLAIRLGELARSLEQEEDSEATLAMVVRAAVELIPGTAEGSISVVLNRALVTSHVPSGDLPRQVDALQTETGEGPCLDAVYEQRTVRVADMSTETRWPLFARRAAEAGAASMLSFQLYVEGDNLGALNLYAREPNKFDDESEHVGLVFAAHAAVAFAAVQQHDQLTRALETRDLIGQAKGILMERYHLDGDQAFNLLVRFSQDSNRKLREVATLVVQGAVGSRDAWSS